MDDGEDLFENCNAVTLAWVWDWLIQSTRRFFIYTLCPSNSCAIKNTYSHFTQFLLCVYSFSG